MGTSVSQDEVERVQAVARARPAGGTFRERLSAVAEALAHLLPVPAGVVIGAYDLAELRPPDSDAGIAHSGEAFPYLGPDAVTLQRFDPAALEDFMANYAPHDVTVPDVVSRGAAGFHIRELLSRRGLKWGTDPVTGEFCRRHDSGDGVGAFVPLDRSVALHVVHYAHGYGRSRFGERDLRLLRLVLPDLMAAARAAVDLERVRVSAQQCRAGDPAQQRIGALLLKGSALTYADAGALALLRRTALADPAEALVRWAGAAPSGAETVWPLLPEGYLRLRSSDATAVRVVTLEALQPGTADYLGASMTRWRLSPREGEVATFAIQGLATKEIARELGIAPDTVKVLLGRVYRKTATAGRIELVALLLGKSSVS